MPQISPMNWILSITLIMILILNMKSNPWTNQPQKSNNQMKMKTTKMKW